VKVEIFSDVVCPWCYLGKRRFDAALAQFEHRDDVEVRYRSFELDPQAPRERDVDLATHLSQKYGMSREEALERHAELAALGAADGIEFRFERARPGNTFDAHRLLQLAATHSLQPQLKERLMRAYHTEGEPIGDPATLARLAVQSGLGAEEVEEVLAGERFREEVRADERTASMLGIGGVPFFVADRTLAVSGAQRREVFAELLAQGWSAAAAPAPAA
jgi:predicted DsbA family dithiol-disulfide isomerase